jgi:type II secretion system protein I
MSRSRSLAGFTLVEVLVALVIVAFGMGTVLAALSAAGTNTSTLRERSIAEWVGFNRIAAVRLELQPPALGDTEGDVQFANDKWHWYQHIDDLQNDIQVPGIKRITVRVRRASSATAADTKQADKSKQTWTATVVGFRGDAVALSSGELPNWSSPPATSAGTAGSSSSSGAGVSVGPVTNSGQSSGTTGTSSSGG